MFKNPECAELNKIECRGKNTCSWDSVEDLCTTKATASPPSSL